MIILDQRRLDESDSELDRKELDWWNKYSYLEAQASGYKSHSINWLFL